MEPLCNLRCSKSVSMCCKRPGSKSECFTMWYCHVIQCFTCLRFSGLHCLFKTVLTYPYYSFHFTDFPLHEQPVARDEQVIGSANATSHAQHCLALRHSSPVSCVVVCSLQCDRKEYVLWMTTLLVAVDLLAWTVASWAARLQAVLGFCLWFPMHPLQFHSRFQWLQYISIGFHITFRNCALRVWPWRMAEGRSFSFNRA